MSSVELLSGRRRLLVTSAPVFVTLAVKVQLAPRTVRSVEVVCSRSFEDIGFLPGSLVEPSGDEGLPPAVLPGAPASRSSSTATPPSTTLRSSGVANPPATARWGDISDEDLMRRIQADDTRAYEALYDRHIARAFGLARAICRNPHRAEEATQDGFLTVWRSRSTYDPARGSARTWLLMVIRHRSIDLVRTARRDEGLRASESELDYLPAPDSVARDAEQHDEADRLGAFLHQLPVLQREVIVLAYFAGLTHTEIAARLRLPAGTVKARIRLGLDKLRAESNPAFTLARSSPEPSRPFSAPRSAKKMVAAAGRSRSLRTSSSWDTA